MVCCLADSAGGAGNEGTGLKGSWTHKKSSLTVVEQTVLVKGTMQSFVLKSVSVCGWVGVCST